jgi:starvation-inducible outer membrane lipoprotein
MRGSKIIAAGILLAAFALMGTGCVTVGYDFLKQQATVTVTPSTKGLAK